MYPLAGIRGAFPELPPIILETEELRRLSQDIDEAYDRLPWTEKRRAARGHRHENLALMVWRDYRFNLNFSAVLIIVYGSLGQLLAEKTLNVVSDWAAIERQCYLLAVALSATSLLDQQKRIVPEAVLCFLKHTAVLRATFYLSLALSKLLD